LESHIVSCDRTYMQRQIDELTVKLVEKEVELAYVKAQLVEQQQQSESSNNNASGAHDNVNNNNRKVIVAPPEIYLSLAKGLNKLEEESQKALEEAAATIKKTKEAIKESAGTVLTNIKHAFEEAHGELVTKFNRLIRSLERERRPLNPVPVAPQEPVSEDVELKQVMEASEASFKEESVLRASEDEQLKQALRLSLLETSTEAQEEKIDNNVESANNEEAATTESDSSDDSELL